MFSKINILLLENKNRQEQPLFQNWKIYSHKWPLNLKKDILMCKAKGKLFCIPYIVTDIDVVNDVI